jgi:hypothetical protein
LQEEAKKEEMPVKDNEKPIEVLEKPIEVKEKPLPTDLPVLNEVPMFKG